MEEEQRKTESTEVSDAAGSNEGKESEQEDKSQDTEKEESSEEKTEKEKEPEGQENQENNKEKKSELADKAEEAKKAADELAVVHEILAKYDDDILALNRRKVELTDMQSVWDATGFLASLERFFVPPELSSDEIQKELRKIDREMSHIYRDYKEKQYIEYRLMRSKEDYKARIRVQIKMLESDIEKAQKSIEEAEARLKEMNLNFDSLEKSGIIAPQKLYDIRQRDIEELEDYEEAQRKYLIKLEKHKKEVEARLGVFSEVEKKEKEKFPDLVKIRLEVQDNSDFQNAIATLLETIVNNPELLDKEDELEKIFTESFKAYIENDEDFQKELEARSNMNVDDLVKEYYKEIKSLINDIIQNPVGVLDKNSGIFKRLKVGDSGLSLGSILDRFLGKKRDEPGETREAESPDEEKTEKVNKISEKFNSYSEDQKNVLKRYIKDEIISKFALAKFEQRRLQDYRVQEYFKGLIEVLGSDDQNRNDKINKLKDEYFIQEEKVSELLDGNEKVKKKLEELSKLLSKKSHLDENGKKELLNLSKDYEFVINGIIKKRAVDFEKAIRNDIENRSSEILSESEKNRMFHIISMETQASVIDEGDDFREMLQNANYSENKLKLFRKTKKGLFTRLFEKLLGYSNSRLES